MKTVLLTVLTAGVALVVLYALWGSVHLLSRARMGIRRIGCRGPVRNEQGNQVCCHTGEPCESVTEERLQQN